MNKWIARHAALTATIFSSVVLLLGCDSKVIATYGYGFYLFPLGAWLVLYWSLA